MSSLLTRSSLFRCSAAWGVLLLVLVFMALGLSACSPPEAMAPAVVSGHRIEKVTTPQGNYELTLVKSKLKGLANQSEVWQTPDPVGAVGGTLYLSSIGDGPKTFNSWASFDATSSEMGGYMLSGLIDNDPYTGAVRPWLAKSVTVEPDGCTYWVELRQGLRWSDGKPLTSEDVTFTWNTIIKQGLGNPSMRTIVSVAGKFPEVKAFGSHRMRFKTAKPFAPFLRSLGQAIAPAHIFKPLLKAKGVKAFDAAWSSQDAATHPERFVSNGLWVLEKYEPGQQASFKRNPYSGLQDSNGTTLPYIQRLVVRFVRDLNNQQLLFEQGALDVYEVPPNLVSRVRSLKQPDFNLYNLGPTSASTFFVFNLNKRKDASTGKPLVSPVVSGWFQKQAFRQALDWALDRSLMVETILKGVGSPLFTAESFNGLYLNKTVAKGHPQNLNKAKALLQQAGFSWTSSGQLQDGEKNPVRFSLLTNAGNDIREASGLAIKEDFKALGIEVDFKPIEFNTLVGRVHSGQWEAIVLGLTGGDPYEPHFSANVWKSDGPVHLFYQRSPGDTLNDRLPWEKELDRIFETAAQQLEPAKRRPLYERYQQVLSEQAPMLYLYSPLRLSAVRGHVQNLNMNPLSPFHNLYGWWLSQPEKSLQGKS